ncbi:MAG: GDSL family lipase [Lachnospiraceae bacterium]|nr:GDSL family lipase [Lachnospiraceae bacterium]
MYDYSPIDSDHIRIYGRTVKRKPLPLFWTASGIEFDTDSTEAYVDIECNYTTFEMYLRVEMDGFCIQRFMVPIGRHEVCLFRGFPAGELKTVRVVFETQPMGDDNTRHLLIHRITTDCVLQPVTPAARRIEFIGDSLTSGEGLTGTSDRKEWCAGIFGLTGHYALEVAKHFDAEYSIVSQSGWGVYCGWDNDIRHNIPGYYTQVCGVLQGAENDALGAHEKWDFASWQPDLIVVNLGTNDGGATTAPEWLDPETGIVHKQLPIEDSEWDHGSRSRFESAVVDFLKLLRTCNPDAYILWVYGMCGPLMEPYIMESIEKYKADTGDARVWYQSLPECPEEDWGAHAHPGVKNHAEAASIIISEIERKGIL